MTERTDSSGRGDALVGSLCWFREPPLMRAVVRVARVERESSPGMYLTEIEVLASDVRHPVAVLEPGSTNKLSGPVSGGSYCGWSLTLLAAETLDTAILEVEADHGGVRSNWWRAGETQPPLKRRVKRRPGPDSI